MADKPTTPPPAYFLSLSLENVRSFGAKQTISFARPDGRPAQWTIILGDNGVGKTTVLKSLVALQPVADGDTKPESLFPNFDGRWKSKWWPARTNQIGDSELECEAVADNKLGVTGSRIFCDIWHIVLINGSVDKMAMQGVIPEMEGLICYGYGAGRTTGNSTLSEAPEATDTCASLFDDRADLLNPEEWFLNIDYGSKLAGAANTQLADARDRVERMLIDVLPGVTEIRIAAAGTPQKPQISLQFQLHDTWVRLRDMSLGYQTLVVWLTDLASKLYIRYPESANPLAEPAIVLIDEIDLHLHPKWQRELLGILSGIFPETQFIATAHSPLVVQAAGDVQANVVLLRREGDQTIVVQDLPDVRRWRVEQILNSELFDDTSPLSPQTEADLTRRNELLLKKRLTKAEKAELSRLEQAVAAQPVGATGPERQAEDLLARLARSLGPEGLLK